MSTHNAGVFQSSGPNGYRPPKSNAETRNCKQDALSEREFERFVETTHTMSDSLVGLQARFIAFVAGRLGLRAGEIVHLQEDWVDYTEQMLRVPAWEQCESGKDGSVCSLCHRLAEQKRSIALKNIAHHNCEGFEAGDGDPMHAIEASPRVAVAELPTHDDFLETMWSPKTENSVRGIYFGYDTRIKLTLEDFFSYWGCFPRSYQTARRRITTVAEQTECIDSDDLYLHALRSTAANHHSGRGLGALELKAMFGWSQLSTAMRYLSDSDANVKRALNAVHNR